MATDEPEQTAIEPDAAASATRGRAPLTVLPWIVAVLALGLAAFATTQWLGLKGEADARADVAVAANGFLLELVNWDAGDGLEDTVQALRDRGTGRFLAQAEDLFGGPLGDELEVAAARSEGEVEDLFVQSVDGSTAEVFAVVRQRVSSTVTTGTEQRLRQVILRLEQVDGEWRVENLELPEILVQPGAPGDEEG